MFYAKAMYDGGLFISADISNYFDYKHLGLRCIFCGEEVFLKKGEKRQSHFSHFKQLANNSEKCPYRTSIFSSKTWSNLTLEGRNQRRYIFQQYFLEIINLSYPLFVEKTNKISENMDCNLDQLVNFLKLTKREILLCLEKNENIVSGENKIFQKLVVMEVIDYLYLPHTTNLFLKIIYFIIKENDDLSRKGYLYWTSNQNHFELHNFTINFLLDVNWSYYLELCTNNKIQKLNVNSNEIISKQDNPNKITNNQQINNIKMKIPNENISGYIMIKVPVNSVLFTISNNNLLSGTINIDRLGIISFLPHSIQSPRPLIIGKISKSPTKKWCNKIHSLKIAELIESNKIDEATKLCCHYFGNLSGKIIFEFDKAYFSKKLIAYIQEIQPNQYGYYPYKVIITKGYIDRKNEDKYTQKFDITNLFKAPHIHSAIYNLIKKWNRIHGKYLKDIKKMLSKILNHYTETDVSLEKIDIILELLAANNTDLTIKNHLLPAVLYIKGSKNIDHYKCYQEICQYLDDINV